MRPPLRWKRLGERDLDNLSMAYNIEGDTQVGRGTLNIRLGDYKHAIRSSVAPECKSDNLYIQTRFPTRLYISTSYLRDQLGLWAS